MGEDKQPMASLETTIGCPRKRKRGPQTNPIRMFVSWENKTPRSLLSSTILRKKPLLIYNTAECQNSIAKLGGYIECAWAIEEEKTTCTARSTL